MSCTCNYVIEHKRLSCLHKSIIFTYIICLYVYNHFKTRRLEILVVDPTVRRLVAAGRGLVDPQRLRYFVIFSMNIDPMIFYSLLYLSLDWFIGEPA